MHSYISVYTLALEKEKRGKIKMCTWPPKKIFIKRCN